MKKLWIVMNESKYRSPKWHYRKFIDFEVNTGEDINGKISKNNLGKAKIKKEEELNNWKKKWRETDRNYLKILKKL